MSERIPIHQRSYETEAFDEGDGRMRVRGRLIDNKPQGLCLADGSDLVIHDMRIDLLVDPETFTIVAVENEMMVRPYSHCEAILPNYQALVGVSITRATPRRSKSFLVDRMDVPIWEPCCRPWVLWLSKRRGVW